jgi:predicted Ser/Thr protein kinase
MDFKPGDKLGPYEILAPLGAGGMGQVWKARDMRLERFVAIKTAHERFSERFEREARSVAALNHPNICQLYDIGPDYLVMEFVEGAPVSPPDTLRKLIDIAVQIAEGLAAPHAAGIVHRDLKPDNILITREGRVKILDFGLAKAAPPENGPDDETRAAPLALTDPGTIVGTIAYMSPEQARGQTNLTAQSDQFSLGLVLYELATGKKAFQRASPAEIMTAIIREDIEPLPASVPAPLRWIVERLLHKEPAERYDSTRDLYRELRQVRDRLSESVSVSMAASAIPAVRRAPSRASKILALIGLAAALLLGAALAALWMRPARADLTFRPITFRRGMVAGARFAQDGQSILYAASWDGQPLDLFSVEPGSPESRPLGFAPACLFAIARTAEMAISVGCRFQNSFITTGTLATMALNGRAPREMRENVAFADWAPDGRQLAITTSDSPRRLEYPPGHVLFTASGTGWPGPVRISPQGERIAFVEHNYFGGNGTVTILDRTGRLIARSEKFALVDAIAWSPDGSEVWFTAARVNADASLYAMNLAGKARLLLSIPGALTLFDVSRDAKVLLGRVDDRDSIELLGPGDETSRDMSWLDWSTLDDLSEDGRTLAFEESGSGVTPEDDVAYIRKTDGSPAVRIGPKWRGQALSPDGKWLFAVQEQDPNESGFMLLRFGPAIRCGLRRDFSSSAARHGSRIVAGLSLRPTLKDTSHECMFRKLQVRRARSHPREKSS